MPRAGMVMWLRTSRAPSWPVLVLKGSTTRWQVRALGSNLPCKVQQVSVVHSSRLVDITSDDVDLSGLGVTGGGVGVASAYRLAYEYIRDKGFAEQRKHLAKLGSHLGVEAQRYWIECADAVERITAELDVNQVALYDAIYDEKELQDLEAEAAIVAEEAKANVSGATEALEVARRQVIEAEAEHAKKVKELDYAKNQSLKAASVVKQTDDLVQEQRKQLQVGKEKLMAAAELRKQLKEQQHEPHQFVQLAELTPLKLVHLESSEVSTLQTNSSPSPSHVADVSEMMESIGKSNPTPAPASVSVSASQSAPVATPKSAPTPMTKKKERVLPWIATSYVREDDFEDETNSDLDGGGDCEKSSRGSIRKRSRIVESEDEEEVDESEEEEEEDDDMEVVEEAKANELRHSTRNRCGGRINYREGAKQRRIEECNVGVRTRSRLDSLSDTSFEPRGVKQTANTQKSGGNLRATRQRSWRTLDFGESDSD